MVNRETDEIPEDWLNEFNARMSQQGIPHIRRPFLALMEWTSTYQCTIFNGSAAERRLFQWFYDRSPVGAHNVPRKYVGPFYFDSTFWPMWVPQIYGINVELNLADFIDMPEAVKDSMFRSIDVATQYKSTWADCSDYSYGLDDVRFSAEPMASKPFLVSATQQLSAAASLLLQRPAEGRAMEASRMAVEMFMKAYLCIHHGFTKEEAVAYKHRLGDLRNAIHSRDAQGEIAAITGQHLAIFPAAVGERYEGKEYGNVNLWHAYRVALYSGACVARIISNRRMRGELGIVFE
ncbi:MAG: hypothetical protein LLG20_00365 [Acidobacteriales bacterium]|nr:hypothetical protein [Terriglobales bacterium]